MRAITDSYLSACLAVLLVLSACVPAQYLPEPPVPHPQTQPTEAPAATPETHPEAGPWSVYDPDPQHLWNRLFRQFFRRTSADGDEYGHDALDPLLWPDTTHLLDGPSHQEAVQLLDEFLATEGEKLIDDPLKRAKLQRDLWAVFDWLSLPFGTASSYPQQRQALQQRLAQAVQRLALNRQEILALPDNYRLALDSQVYPTTYHSQVAGGAGAPFLPADLFDPASGWVAIGREGGPMAMTHTEEFPFLGRSAFLVYLRVPGGRDATLDFVRELNAGRFASVPGGTEVALVRRMMLVDERGDTVLSPLVESVQVRHFIHDGRQLFFEFKVDRVLLFAGVSGGFIPVDKALSLFRSHGDRFRSEWYPSPREFGLPQRCVGCHVDRGLQITGSRSILSFSRARFPLPERGRPVLTQTTPEREAQFVIAWKLEHETWQALESLW